MREVNPQSGRTHFRAFELGRRGIFQARNGSKGKGNPHAAIESDHKPVDAGIVADMHRCRMLHLLAPGALICALNGCFRNAGDPGQT